MGYARRKTNDGGTNHGEDLYTDELAGVHFTGFWEQQSFSWIQLRTRIRAG